MAFSTNTFLEKVVQIHVVPQLPGKKKNPRFPYSHHLVPTNQKFVEGIILKNCRHPSHRLSNFR